ncbi:MAG: D-aminoacyl-tRNA deacylase [Deltaproteobacteria bacterium]|nr:D-aminoacyl-tRNA deacylase [Deltaproteobacteria bacterium]
MRAVIQRVSEARVSVGDELVGEIRAGVLVYLGVEKTDDASDLRYVMDKLIALRIWEDSQRKMNLSLRDVSGAVLLVSQFTLCGDTRSGRRPSFASAMAPTEARAMYERAIEILKSEGLEVATGRFGATMAVYAVNDGPVTLLVDSKRLF